MTTVTVPFKNPTTTFTQVSTKLQSVYKNGKRGLITWSDIDGWYTEGGSGDTCSVITDYGGYSWLMFHSDSQCADCTDPCYYPYLSTGECAICDDEIYSSIYTINNTNVSTPPPRQARF
jgi:hypothetical protein